MENNLKTSHKSSHSPKKKLKKKQRCVTKSENPTIVKELLNDVENIFKINKNPYNFFSSLQEDKEPSGMDRNSAPKPVPIIPKIRTSGLRRGKVTLQNSKRKVSIRNIPQPRLSRKSLFTHKSRNSFGDIQSHQRIGSRYRNFVMLEKENEDNEMVDIYRFIKEKLKTSINATEINHETLRENQIKKYKQILANAVLQKRPPTFAFTYQGDIIPVIPVPPKPEEKRYVEVEAEIDEAPEKNKKINQHLSRKKSRMGENYFLPSPSQREVIFEEAESEFQKNFSKLNFADKVSVIGSQKRTEKSQFYKTENYIPYSMKKFTPETTADKDIKVIDRDQFEKILGTQSINKQRSSFSASKEKYNPKVGKSKRFSMQGCNFIEKEKAKLKKVNKENERKGILKKRKSQLIS